MVSFAVLPSFTKKQHDIMLEQSFRTPPFLTKQRGSNWRATPKVACWLNLRTFQQTPGAYPKPPGPTVYVSEFLSFGGERGCLGYAKQGYLGIPLD